MKKNSHKSRSCKEAFSIKELNKPVKGRYEVVNLKDMSKKFVFV